MKLAVGNAIQVGLMALGGRLPYMPDWRVTYFEDKGPREYYRYRVRGENLNCIGEPDYLYSWSIPEVGWRFFWEVQTDPGDYYDFKARQAALAETPAELENARHVGD